MRLLIARRPVADSMLPRHPRLPDQPVRSPRVITAIQPQLPRRRVIFDVGLAGTLRIQRIKGS